jgi:hypothetical protein
MSVVDEALRNLKEKIDGVQTRATAGASASN